MWMKGLLLWLTVWLALATPLAAAAASEVSLDGSWDLLLDPKDRGTEAGLFDPMHEDWNDPLAVTVPGVIESLPETVGYDGVVWYRRRVPDVPTTGGPEDRLLLSFAGVNARADVWLDGEHLLRHDGSDVPFDVDVTGRIASGGPMLVLRVVDPGDRQVDGLLLGAMPHAKESWYTNYGGVTGSVHLRRVPPVEVRVPEIVPPLPGEHGRLRLALVNHTGEERRVRLAAALATAVGPSPPTYDALADGDPVVEDGQVRAAFTVLPGRTEVELPLPVAAGLTWWTPAAPARHLLRVAVANGDHVTTTSRLTGLRRFEVVDGGFVLNGEPIRPWGVLWQPLFPSGLAVPPDDDFLRRELSAIKAAGFDLVRAHIRVVPELYALCDELGLLVHAEPTLGWITTLRDETLPLVDDALVALADGVRGHPSVVMVGLLNELSGELHPHVEALHARAHELLPEHLVLDDSGSWLGTARRLGPGAGDSQPCDDVHLYRAWPWDEDDFAHAASLGADHDDLVYVSEYGFGGIPSLTSALAGFGTELWREDARTVFEDLQAVRKALGAGVLNQIAGDVDTVSLLGQVNQARAAKLMTAALLANPRVAGAVYTQWRDVSWECGAGLVDHWGHPKPVLGEVSTLLRLPAGAGPEQLFGPAPPARARRPVATGSLVALEGEVAGIVGDLVAGHDAGLAGLPRVAVVGRRDNPWGPESIALTVALLRHAEAGGVVLMLEPPDAGRPLPYFLFGYDGLGQVADLPFDVTARPARGHFVGTHFAFRQGSRLLDDLALPVPLLDERFGAAKPHVVLQTGPGIATEVELLCLDGYGLPVGAAVQSVTYGKGRLVLSTLRFDDENLAQPSVARLLENLVRYAASLAVRLPPAGVGPADAPSAELADAAGRHVWRHKIAFGLLERLSVQTFNGERPERVPPPDLELLTKRKVYGLQRILEGKEQEGVDVLAMIEGEILDEDRETFLRKEIELSQAFYEADTERGLVATLQAGRRYSRALRLMSLGEFSAACHELDKAVKMVTEWDSEEAPGEPSPDGRAPTEGSPDAPSPDEG
jgi:hypothetical protein